MATPAQDTPSVRMRLLEYDATRGVFRLASTSPISHPSTGGASVAIWREIGDFQALDRAVHRVQKATTTSTARAVPRLSLRRLKKLTEFNWLRGDTALGWRPELQKNVAFCEQWLDAALAQAEPSDCQRFVDDDAHHAHQRARRETQHAKQLQQYFTGASLVQHVVQRLPELLESLRIEPLDSDRVVWIEPSCGDARIVRALVTAGAKRVMGYELDESVYAAALASVAGVDGVTLTQGDFLTTSRPQVWEGTESVTLLAVGNPPFGSDGGDASDGDLVDKFLLHVALVWRAQLVAFIVPARCARPEYVARLLQKLNEGEAQEDGSKDRRWTMELCEPLEDCTFEFQATKHVKQPSAFVVFATRSQSPV